MPARKRSAPESSTTRRRSGRTSLTKSSYFEGSDSESENQRLAKRRNTKPKVETGDDYEDKPEESEDDEAEFNDESAKAEESEQDEDEDEDDDARPRKVTVIPLEKMRDTGGVEYEDFKVHNNTMLFLKDLKANNKRPWLKSHDGEYRRALKDWVSFVDATTETMTTVDETVPELPAKDVMFRIHRDIRFSKDPTPYKPHFSAAWSRTGRKGPYACYYIHCEPGNAFIGGGLWYPEASLVQKLRRSIDRHPDRWRTTFNDERLRNIFFPQAKSVEGALKAFVAKNQVNALKKKPMGYEATHPDIELLKLKNYTVSIKINEDILCKDNTQAKVAEIMGGLQAFVTFLNSIVMPDTIDDSSDDDDEE